MYWALLTSRRRRVLVAPLGDPALRVFFTRLVAFWRQSQIGAYISAFVRALRVFQGEYKGQRRQGPHAFDGSHSLRFGIDLFTQALDFLFIGLDALAQVLDTCQHWCQRRPQAVRQLGPGFASNEFRGAWRQLHAKALGGAAHMVDQLRASPHQTIPRPQQVQMLLGSFAPMRDRRQQVDIQAHQPRQVFRIHPIALARVYIDQPQLARIGYYHFVA